MTEPSLFTSPPERWIRLEQNRDEEALALAPETYDGLIINATLLASSPASLASFLDKVAKPFLVDPISHRFTRPTWFTREKDGDVVNKRNYTLLWADYVTGVDGMTGDPMRDSALLMRARDDQLARFCQNVIDFQERRLRTAWADEVTRFLNIESLWGPTLRPAAYLAPYIVIGDVEPELEARMAVRLAEATAALGRPTPTAVILPITERLLVDLDALRSLAVALGKTGATAAFVWPVGMTELALADVPARFTGLRLLIRTLSDAGLEPAMLYGGYVSALLKEFGSRAVSHSLLYGQSRGLDPSGGRPACVHYFRPLRQLVSFVEIEQRVTAMPASDYTARICSCEVCVALLESDRGLRPYFGTQKAPGAKRPQPSQEALALNQVHFLHSHGLDLAALRTKPTIVAVAELLEAVERYPLGSAAQRARRWAERLRAA